MDQPGLPPHQQMVAAGKWPVTGERSPGSDRAPWTITVAGLALRPRTWALEELTTLPTVERAIDLHCVTRWSKLAVRFTGVRLVELLQQAELDPRARFVCFTARSQRGHDTSLALSDALALDPLLAWECEGQPLASEHGGPLRLVVPGRYFYKSLKWLERIEGLAEDRLGFWERTAGYHNTADPWLGQRYMAPSLSRQQAARAIAARDFSDHDLRSLDARSRDLQGLIARRACLRDADFRSARLSGADFSGANLSNGHFAGADLRDASFGNADLEGADFAGADLRGADFRGAALTGTSFYDAASSAQFDARTRLDRDGIEALLPEQQEFVRRQSTIP